MAKISINLNPHKEKQQGIVAQSLSSYLPQVFIGAVVFFLLILLLNVFVLIRIGFYGSYQRQWKQWEAKAREISTAKKDIAQLEAKNKELQGIVVPQIEASKMLAATFSALPDNIWFESLSYKKNSLSLKGYVIQWKEDYLASLDKFINTLKADAYFSSIFKKSTMVNSEKKNFQGVEVLEFIIECAK
ncbi:MAG: hypothetical protein PHQ96_03010 [Candidatus Omnitrophica bacterium]|nr:hypothetical protein [Candidatus Omnitrophota bacterium]